MIKITYRKNKDQVYLIESQGHANYDEYGKDIVCAAVSAILIGGLNAINDISNFSISKKDGFLKIERLVDNINDNDNIVLNTILIQLRTIEESYPKFIKIKTIE